MGGVGAIAKMVGLDAAGSLLTGTASAIKGFLVRAWPVAVALAAEQALDVIHPKGNLGGLTTPVDKWVKSHFWFDPSGGRNGLERS